MCSVQLSIVLRDKIRELKSGQDTYTATVMLVGIPNVGKSAIANSLHEIGRIHAEGTLFLGQVYRFKAF